MTVVDLWYSCGIQSTTGTVVWISRIDFHSGVRWWILSALLWRTPCFGPTISCSLYRGCCIRSLAYLQRSSVVAKEQTHVSWCQHGMLACCQDMLLILLQDCTKEKEKLKYYSLQVFVQRINVMLREVVANCKINIGTECLSYDR